MGGNHTNGKNTLHGVNVMIVKTMDGIQLHPQLAVKVVNGMIIHGQVMMDGLLQPTIGNKAHVHGTLHHQKVGMVKMLITMIMIKILITEELVTMDGRTATPAAKRKRPTEIPYTYLARP